MTRQEADEILGWLLGAYPHQSQMTADVYGQAFESMQAEDVGPVVLNWIKTEPKLPSLFDIRKAISNIKRLAQAEQDAQAWRQLPAEPLQPERWVERWRRARAAGDERLFPEQEPGIRRLNSDNAVNGRSGYEEMYAKLSVMHGDASVWVQPGEYAEVEA